MATKAEFMTRFVVDAVYKGQATFAKIGRDLGTIETKAHKATRALQGMHRALSVGAGVAGGVLGAVALNRAARATTKFAGDAVSAYRKVMKAQEGVRLSLERNAETWGYSAAEVKRHTAALLQAGQRASKLGQDTETLQVAMGEMAQSLDPKVIEQNAEAVSDLLTRWAGVGAQEEQALEMAEKVNKFIFKGEERGLKQFKDVTEYQLQVAKEIQTVEGRRLFFQQEILKRTHETERAYDTLEGTIALVGKAIEDIYETIGKPLVESLRKSRLGEVLLGILGKLQEKADLFAEKLGPVLERFATDLEKHTPEILAFFEALGNVFIFIIDHWKEVSIGLGVIVAGLGLLVFVVAPLMAVTSGLMALGGAVAAVIGTGALGGVAVVLGVIIAAVVALTYSIYLLIKHWDKVKKAALFAIKAIKAQWTLFVLFFKGTWAAINFWFVSPVKVLWDLFYKWFIKPFEDWWGGLISWFRDPLAKIWKAITDKFKQIWEDIKKGAPWWLGGEGGKEGQAAAQAAPYAMGSGATGPQGAAAASNYPATAAAATAANVGALKDVRARFAQELNNPAVMQKVMASVEAEVGSQGADAKLAYLESIMNRAAARNQTLLQAATDPGYYPDLTKDKLDRIISGKAAEEDKALIDKALGGSNISDFATGNWSGRQGAGFGEGGFKTKDIGGEQFGVEAADVAWRKRQQAASSGQAATTGATGGGKRAGVSPDMITRLEDLEKQFGPIDVVSGVRDPSKNASVGGAKGSEHTHANAVDLDTSSWPQEKKLALIRAATRAGVKGIGVYRNNIHLDMGHTHGRRAWGPSHGRGSVPSWAEGAIREHESFNEITKTLNGNKGGTSSTNTFNANPNITINGMNPGQADATARAVARAQQDPLREMYANIKSLVNREVRQGYT